MKLLPACDACNSMPPFGSTCQACGRLGLTMMYTYELTKDRRLQVDDFLANLRVVLALWAWTEALTEQAYKRGVFDANAFREQMGIDL